MLIVIESLAPLAAVGRRKGSEKVFKHPCGTAGGGVNPPGRWDDDGKVQQVPAKYVRVFNMKSLPVLVVGDSVVARYNVCGKWFVATVEAVNGNYCNLKYRDGETEADVRRDLVTHYSVYANQRSAIVKALLKSGKLLLAPCTFLATSVEKPKNH